MLRKSIFLTYIMLYFHWLFAFYSLIILRDYLSISLCLLLLIASIGCHLYLYGWSSRIWEASYWILYSCVILEWIIIYMARYMTSVTILIYIAIGSTVTTIVYSFIPKETFFTEEERELHNIILDSLKIIALLLIIAILVVVLLAVITWYNTIKTIHDFLKILGG